MNELTQLSPTSLVPTWSENLSSISQKLVKPLHLQNLKWDIKYEKLLKHMKASYITAYLVRCGGWICTRWTHPLEIFITRAYLVYIKYKKEEIGMKRAPLSFSSCERTWTCPCESFYSLFTEKTRQWGFYITCTSFALTTLRIVNFSKEKASSKINIFD